MLTKINDERKNVIRLIRKKSIKPLAENTDSETSHSHDNKDDLDRLSIENNKLLIDNSPLILKQEDW